jgi:hypothetical protein
MPELKATPGPWSVGPANIVAQRSTDEQGRRTTRFVAEAVLSTPLVEGEQDANARLIAAAPELYSALSDAVDLLQMSGYSTLEHTAALRKARGDAA